jgi:uncharacterized membrane protein YqgA involved in biofilm formation
MSNELELLDFYLDGVTNFTVCSIGLAINAWAVCMLRRQKTSSIFVKLMISLVTYDLIYVFLFATCYSLPRLSLHFKGTLNTIELMSAFLLYPEKVFKNKF